MRTLMEISSSVGRQDAIIESSGSVKKDKDHKPIVNGSGIASFRRVCDSVKIYYREGNDCTIVGISAQSILELAKKIKELNQEEYEDVFE